MLIPNSKSSAVHVNRAHAELVMVQLMLKRATTTKNVYPMIITLFEAARLR